jgi:hypothetical protein
MSNYPGDRSDIESVMSDRNTTMEFKVTEKDRERGHFFWKSEKLGPGLYRNTCLCGTAREGGPARPDVNLFQDQLDHLREFIPGYQPMTVRVSDDT